MFVRADFKNMDGTLDKDRKMQKDSIWFYPFDAGRDYWAAHDKWPAGTHFEFHAQPKQGTDGVPEMTDKQRKEMAERGKRNNVAKGIGEDGEMVEEGEGKTKGKTEEQVVAKTVVEGELC
jgi:hypothetical protein